MLGECFYFQSHRILGNGVLQLLIWEDLGEKGSRCRRPIRWLSPPMSLGRVWYEQSPTNLLQATTRDSQFNSNLAHRHRPHHVIQLLAVIPVHQRSRQLDGISAFIHVAELQIERVVHRAHIVENIRD